MAKAVICPICNGTGKYRILGNTTLWSETTCHGCGGKGWVEVLEDHPWSMLPVLPYSPTIIYRCDKETWETTGIGQDNNPPMGGTD